MQTGNGGRFYQYKYDLGTLWTCFSGCSEGRGLDGSPMEGIFVEMDRVGGGVLTHGKRQSCAYFQY